MSHRFGFHARGSKVAHLPGWVIGRDTWWLAPCGRFDGASPERINRLVWVVGEDDVGLRLCARCDSVARSQIEWWLQVIGAWIP